MATPSDRLVDRLGALAPLFPWQCARRLAPRSLAASRSEGAKPRLLRRRLRAQPDARVSTTRGRVAAAGGAAELGGELLVGGAPGDAPESTSGRGKLKVAVDVDEVLGHFVPQLNKYVADVYGERYEVCHYGVYDFKHIWGVDQDESNRRGHAFFESRHFVEIPAVDGALSTLQRVQGCCNLEVVTSRQHVIEDDTRQWLGAHFSGVFDDVHFGNHFAMNGTSRKKSEICDAIGADVLIDDNLAYAADCAQAGMRVLLFDFRGEYPWSKPTQPLHSNVSVVHSWQEVEMALVKLSKAKAKALSLGAAPTGGEL